MRKSIISVIVIAMFAMTSCIQITNENKAINGSNDEGGNSFTRENYEYNNNSEYGSTRGSSSTTPSSSFSTSSSSVSSSMSRYSGTVGSYPVTMYINPSVTSGKIGYYYYNKYKKSIDLYVSGYDYDGDGTVEFELTENTSGHGQTGVFRIAVYPSHSIRGSFVNSKGQYFDVNLN
jgi:hypothetical protein